MIKVFRNMRRGLLAKNKLLQYIVYASGEIILVIAGILIALAINNQSELNKKDEQIASIMKQIRQDLLTDILRTTSHIEFYHSKDSLMNLILFDALQREDYEKPSNRQLYQVTTTVIEFVTNDKGYQSLVRNIDNLPARYEPLINDLNQLFINDKIMVDRFNKSISDVTDGILKDWEHNQQWYSRLMTGSVNQEAVDYFYQDPFYKNHVTSYSIIAIQNHLPVIKIYRINAIESFKAITALLNLEYDESLTKQFLIPENKLEALTGTYTTQGTFDISVRLDEEGNLVAQATGQGSFELYPLSATRFTALGISVMVDFKLNEQGEATEMVVYQGSGAVNLSKN